TLTDSLARRCRARVDEYRQHPKRGLALPAVECAYHFGRHARGDVDDELCRRIGDEIQTQSRAVGLAINLLRGVQTLVEVVQNDVLLQRTESITHRNHEHLGCHRVANRDRARRGQVDSILGPDLGKDLPAFIVDGRVIERVHQELLAYLPDRGPHLTPYPLQLGELEHLVDGAAPPLKVAQAGQLYLGIARQVLFDAENVAGHQLAGDDRHG